MSVAEALAHARRLTRDQRRELAEILISEVEADDEVSPDLLAELDRRAEQALKNPARCRPWADVRKRLRKRLSRPQ